MRFTEMDERADAVVVFGGTNRRGAGAVVSAAQAAGGEQCRRAQAEAWRTLTRMKTKWEMDAVWTTKVKAPPFP